MKKVVRLSNKLTIAFVFLITNILHAATQPKFTIIPTTATSLSMQSTDVATVQYVVTNKTKITRTLTMAPIKNGITQITGGSGGCGNPFILANNQSCVLTIQISAALLPVGRTSNPVKICKTITGTNTPDPFLCSQTSQANNLDITRFPEKAVISSNTRSLQLTVDGTPQSITITNRSYNVSAQNINAILAGTSLEGNVVVTANTCQNVAPRASCVITFSATQPVATSPVNVQIRGSNTNTISILISTIIPNTAQLSITGSPLVLYSSGSNGTIYVTNNGPTIVANNITAILPPSLSTSVTLVDRINCDTVNVGDVCQLVFKPHTKSLSSTQIPIYGSNTSIVYATIAVNNTGEIEISISPTSLTMQADGTSTQTITITNQSTTSNATNVVAYLSNVGSVTATSCPTIAFGSSCIMTFNPGTTVIGPTNFLIYGKNTTTVTAEVSVGSYFVYVANNGGVNGDTSTLGTVSLCNLSVTTGNLSNCTEIAADQYTTSGVAINSSGTNAYVITNTNSNTSAGVNSFSIDPSNGTLTNTATTSAGLSSSSILNGVGFYNGFLYITWYDSASSKGVLLCTIDSSGSVSSCTDSGATSLTYPFGIAFNQQLNIAYIINYDVASITQCNINTSTGALSSCTENTSIGDVYNMGIAVNSAGTYAYISNSGNGDVIQCSINQTNGNLTNCNTQLSLSNAYAIAINSITGFLYVATDGTDYTEVIAQCTIDPSTGVPSGCVNSGSGFNFPYGIALYPTP